MSMDNTTLPLVTARGRFMVALMLSLALTACGSGGGEQQAAAPVDQSGGGGVTSPVEQPGAADDGLPVTVDPAPAPDLLPDDVVVDTPVVGGGADGVPSSPEQGSGVVVEAPQPGEGDQSEADSGEGSIVVVVPTPGDQSPADELFGNDDNALDDGLGELGDVSDVGGADGDSGDIDGGAVDQPVTGEIVADDSNELDSLFGGAPSEPGSGISSPSRELRWLLPSERMDGSQLARNELQAFELWGAASDKPLEKWATLHPATKSYSLAKIPSGRYRFALVTVDRDGLRSDLSTVVVREFQ